MAGTVTIETQGISADWDRADGVYDPVERGAMDHAGLLAVLARARVLEVPAERRMGDQCPPHVMTEGAAGRFSFVMDGGALYCEETECEIAPQEAADLAFGRETVAAVTHRHTGESGKAFVQGPERARTEAKAAEARAARRAAAVPKPIGLARRILGYVLAAGFIVAGLAALGAGLEGADAEGNADDLSAALFMGGLLLFVGLAIGWAVRRAARKGVRRARGRRGVRAGAAGRRDNDRWDDDDDRDDDDRDDPDDDGGGADSD